MKLSIISFKLKKWLRIRTNMTTWRIICPFCEKCHKYYGVNRSFEKWVGRS